MSSPSDKTRVENWKKNSIIVDGHWRYQGHHTKSGHGQVRFNRVNMSIARASAILFLGLRPYSAYLVCHKRTCPYPDCWNPECLYIGTESSNAKDRHA